MLVYANDILGTPILSMQSADVIGYVFAPLVDPDSLKIVAFVLSGPLITGDNILLDTKSIREYSKFGMVVDSIDELVGRDDVVHISRVIDLQFDILDLKVETKHGTRLGRITDYLVTSDDYTITQIVVKRPFVKSFFDPKLLIPRDEILEVTNTKIIVKDEEKTIREKAENTEFTPNFVNPFRKTEPVHSPVHTKTPDDTDKQ